MTEDKKKLVRKIALLAGICAVIALVTLLAGRAMIDFVSDPAIMHHWVEENYWGSRLGFVGLVALQVILAFIPGEPFEIAAGFAFGNVQGMVLSMAGITLGSVAVFLAVKKWGMKLVRLFFSEEKIRSVRLFQNPKRLNNIAFIVFLIPGTPKDLLTYLVGLTPMTLPNWLLICTVARIPSLVTSVLGGAAIGQKDYLQAALVFAVTALFSLAGLWVYNKANARLQKRREAGGDGEA